MNYTKLFLRSLFGGLLFGSFLGLCFWTIFKSFVVGMLIWLAFGGTFGLLMATFDVVTTKWLTKKLTKKYSNYEWMRPHHEREITLSIPYEKAFELCLDVVKSLSRCKVQEVNKAIGRITAIRLSKFLSWRHTNQITIDLKRINENETLVKISSKKMYQCLSNVDFGENLENVEEISSRLKAKFKKDLID